jgi:UDP-N-acetylmuramoyl-L-alanyl-D-glutamate--2,6-diaminopimelate ligase
MVGTLGIGVPMYEVSTGLTTPDPITLHKKLKAYLNMGFKYCAIEASSIGIEEHRSNGVSIHTAVFTNFTQDHLDYHGNMNAYWEAKLKLFEWDTLKSAVINIDDVKGRTLVEHLKSRPLDIWTISITGAARIQAHDIGYGKQGINFNITENEITHALQTQFYGKYNVSNILCVIATMRANGIELKACIDACKSLTAVPGRMDVINRDNKPLVVVDYAHTPDALKQALVALRPVVENRLGHLICIFGCGGNRDSSKRPMMAAIAEEYADYVVVTNDNSRMEVIDNIINNILVGFKAISKYSVELNRGSAIAETIKNAKSNDVILIAGKGHENYQDEMGVKSYFSDKAQALKAMEAVSSVDLEVLP